MTTPSKSAMALRAAFGDRKPPDISRKITACVACRKLKIKCSMSDDGPPCERCEKRGLSCTVNKSLQMLLESDLSYESFFSGSTCLLTVQSWKDKIEERLARLESTIAQMPLHDTRHIESTLQADHSDQTFQRPSSPVRQDQIESIHDEQNQWEVVVDGGGAPDAVPASYISEVSNPSSPHQIRQTTSRQLDVISRGILNVENATVLFDIYHTRLDHFVYSILGDYHSLQEVRHASPLLTDAICTVSSLHSSTENYAACRSAFMQQVSKKMFSKRHCADDVRALIVGAFWLSDLSWALIGAAVRIATEINLHRSFVRPNYDSREWYLNARLYLQVWCCDHHLSIVYGRSPMTESFRNLDFGGRFLSSEHACQDDTRLFSQVEVWMISYRTYKSFGIDNEAALSSSCLSDFRRIGIALDTWQADWEERLTFDEYLGNYPRKGSGLHYNFAKLYLCSHAYRGLLNAQENRSDIPFGLEEFAAKAISAADAILRVIISDSEIQSYLNGLPTYFDTMIAFAVVFLLKALSKAPRDIRVHKPETLDLLSQISAILLRVTTDMRKEHILCSISRSVGKLVEKAMSTSFEEVQHAQQQVDPASWNSNLYTDDFAWLMSSDNSMFVGNFDLTGPAYDIDFNFMDTSPTC